MDLMNTNKQSVIGLIGGGRAGLQLLNLFTQSPLTRVAYIVDQDRNAPAMTAAEALNIPALIDLQQALHQYSVDYIYEVTGSKTVIDILRTEMDSNSTQLVTHDTASVLLKVIEDVRRNVTEKVFADIQGIQHETAQSLETMTETIDAIRQTTADMKYLALNARIEAARAGEHGRGFDIVAQQVEVSAQSVREMTQEIEKVNAQIRSISERIEASLQELSKNRYLG
jgi:hypothetical protein